MRIAGALVVAAVSLLLCPTSASGQRSTTRGFHFGGHVMGVTIEVDDVDERASGAGAGAFLAYGFTPVITTFLQLDGAGVEVEGGLIDGFWTMAHLDVGARFHVADSTRSWVPYLQLAFTGRAVGVDDARFGNDLEADVSFSGAGLSGGVGLLVYLQEAFALDVQLMLSRGEFSEFTVEEVTVSNLAIDATSGRLDVGVAWWP
jgi:hypothetical protein